MILYWRTYWSALYKTTKASSHSLDWATGNSKIRIWWRHFARRNLRFYPTWNIKAPPRPRRCICRLPILAGLTSHAWLEKTPHFTMCARLNGPHAGGEKEAKTRPLTIRKTAQKNERTRRICFFLPFWVRTVSPVPRSPRTAKGPSSAAIFSNKETEKAAHARTPLSALMTQRFLRQNRRLKGRGWE